MSQIHYDLIGSTPWMDQYATDFDTLMDKALAGDEIAMGLVVNGAAHFYGLSIFDFGGAAKDLPALIDAVRGMDQQLAQA